MTAVVSSTDAGGPLLRPPDTRVALPDGGGGFHVLDVAEESFSSFTTRISDMVGDVFASVESPFPALALREALENLVHAVPCNASVVVDSLYSSISLCDTGRGIERVDMALELGFTTAGEFHRRVIRGVGIGLNLAREEVLSLGGDLVLKSAPGTGTFLRLVLSPAGLDCRASYGNLGLSQRQNNILFLLSEGVLMGPSHISSELKIAVSTAYRDLVRLQELGLVGVGENGKRFLSSAGKSYLQRILSL